VLAAGGTAGDTFTKKAALTVDEATPLGTYRVQACADGGKIVVEDSESDNCLTSDGNVQVTPVADLVVTSVTVVPNPPVTLDAGTGTLTISAVVKNQGAANAGASTMKFVLVKTPAALGNKNLNGTAAVPENLFSHEDQAVQWMTSGRIARTRTGWGGRLSQGRSGELDGNNCFPVPGIVTGTASPSLRRI
jgi:hypothetical protein